MLNLENNKIIDITSLAGLHKLTQLNLRYNNIQDISPLASLGELKKLDIGHNKVIDFEPVAHVQNVVRDNQVVSDERLSAYKHVQFYKTMVQPVQNHAEVKSKIMKMNTFIEDVHQMKFFYTMLNFAYRGESLNKEERSIYIKEALGKVYKDCIDEYRFTTYRLILDKAKADGVINRSEEIVFDRLAENINTGHTDYIKNLQQAVQSHTAQIIGLEGNIKAVHESMKRLQNALGRKAMFESMAGIMGVVLNCICVMPSLTQAFENPLNKIVDFGDFDHVATIVKDAKDVLPKDFKELLEKSMTDLGNKNLKDLLEFGIEQFNETAERRVEDFTNFEISPLVLITTVAAASDVTLPIMLNNPPHHIVTSSSSNRNNYM